MPPEIFPVLIRATAMETVETQLSVGVLEHRRLAGHVIVVKRTMRELRFDRAVGFGGSLGNFHISSV